MKNSSAYLPFSVSLFLGLKLELGLGLELGLFPRKIANRTHIFREFSQ